VFNSAMAGSGPAPPLSLSKLALHGGWLSWWGHLRPGRRSSATQHVLHQRVRMCLVAFACHSLAASPETPACCCWSLSSGAQGWSNLSGSHQWALTSASRLVSGLAKSYTWHNFVWMVLLQFSQVFTGTSTAVQARVCTEGPVGHK